MEIRKTLETEVLASFNTVVSNQKQIEADMRIQLREQNVLVEALASKFATFVDAVNGMMSFSVHDEAVRMVTPYSIATKEEKRPLEGNAFYCVWDALK